MLQLKPTTEKDLNILFTFQLDEQANYLAAFTPSNYNNVEAYLSKWKAIVNNPEIDMQSVWLEEELVGSVLYFTMEGETNVSYIIDRKHWGKGFAKQALKLFLEQAPPTLFYGRTAYDNFGSQKVLEANGFEKIGSEKAFANARNQEIEEYIYRYHKK